jgi:hypothetical protein
MFRLQILFCVFIRGKWKKGNICPLSPLAKATEGKPVKTLLLVFYRIMFQFMRELHHFLAA